MSVFHDNEEYLIPWVIAHRNYTYRITIFYKVAMDESLPGCSPRSSKYLPLIYDTSSEEANLTLVNVPQVGERLLLCPRSLH